MNKQTSSTDPRLAFARSIHEKKFAAMSKTNAINEFSTALDILKGNNLSGKFAIVTGGNRGVGYEIVRALAFTGCYVILACRDIDNGVEVYESLKKERVYNNSLIHQNK